MTLAAFFAYSIALGIAAVIPGPGIAAMLGRALAVGWKQSLPMLLGLALGDVVYLSLAIAGLAVVAQTFSSIFFVIKLAGCCYLLWLAWKFWTSGIEIQDVGRSAGKRDGVASFLAGLAVTLGNPKTIVFYMAILPAVIDLREVGFVDYAMLVALTFGVLFVTILPYLLMADRAREMFKSPKALSRLNRSAAVAMTGTATWILAKG